jgi:hypothetical protein
MPTFIPYDSPVGIDLNFTLDFDFFFPVAFILALVIGRRGFS